MNTFVYFLLGIAYVLLFIWGVWLAKQRGIQVSDVLLLVTIGLIYDNTIIALGRFIGEGVFLENLSYARYWLHALFTPTLILYTWSICFEMGFSFAKKTFWKTAAYLLTFGLIIYELFLYIDQLKLQPTWENELLIYDHEGQLGFPLMIVCVTLALFIVGIIFLKMVKFPWLLVGVIVMCVGSSLSIWLKEFPIMNVMEFILMLSLLSVKKLSRKHLS